MKELIKITIALFFILGAFFIGKYLAKEENKSEIEVLNKKIFILEKQETENENIMKKMKIEIEIYKDTLMKMNKKQGITAPMPNSL